MKTHDQESHYHNTILSRMYQQIQIYDDKQLKINLIGYTKFERIIRLSGSWFLIIFLLTASIFNVCKMITDPSNYLTDFYDLPVMVFFAITLYYEKKGFNYNRILRGEKTVKLRSYEVQQPLTNQNLEYFYIQAKEPIKIGEPKIKEVDGDKISIYKLERNLEFSLGEKCHVLMDELSKTFEMPNLSTLLLFELSPTKIIFQIKQS